VGNHVLTAEDVEVIHERLVNGEKGVDIARDFAVSQQTVSSIRTGESWGYATGVNPDAPRPNTDRGSLRRDDVRAIDQLLKEGVEVAVLARSYGVSYQTIYAIRMGRTWSWLTGRPVINPRRNQK
jgi:hypothetical protein